MDCHPPGSSVHGISWPRILEWVAISFSNAWKWKVKVKSLSRVRLLQPTKLVCPWDFPGKRTGVGCHRLLHNLSQHQSFLMSWLFTSGGQSIGASASVLPMDIQCWFPLGLTDLISLLSKGHSRVFSNTTVWKHQFSSTHSSLWYNSYIHTWLLQRL